MWPCPGTGPLTRSPYCVRNERFEKFVDDSMLSYFSSAVEGYGLELFLSPYLADTEIPLSVKVRPSRIFASIRSPGLQECHDRVSGDQ